MVDARITYTSGSVSSDVHSFFPAYLAHLYLYLIQTIMEKDFRVEDRGVDSPPYHEANDAIVQDDAHQGGWKARWERSWPTIACGAGLFSDGYIQSVSFGVLLHSPLMPSWGAAVSILITIGYWLCKHSSHSYLRQGFQEESSSCERYCHRLCRHCCWPIGFWLHL